MGRLVGGLELGGGGGQEQREHNSLVLGFGAKISDMCATTEVPLKTMRAVVMNGSGSY
jgi:hypothetical protein